MKIAISIENEAEYNELMERLESKGLKWMSGCLPTKIEMGKAKSICIDFNEKCITFDIYQDLANISFTDLKANDFKLTIQL